MRALVNPKVRGWMHYYGRHSRHELYPLLARINHYIQQWLTAKYHKTPRETAREWARITSRYPGTFAHWQWVTDARW